jgi:hypothetical protein
MKRRFVPTLFALVLFIVLFAYVNVYEVADIPEPGKDPVVELSAIPPEQVKTVTWHLAGTSQKAEADVIKVAANPEGSPEKYQVVSPKPLRADPGEIDGILRHFRELRTEGITVKNATDTSVYGIGTDSPVLTIEGATQSVTLTLGAASPVGGMVYMMRQGDPQIYMVSSVVSSAFHKRLEDLRAKTIFFENFSEVKSAKVESASGTFAFEQRNVADWFMTEPKEAPVDGGEVSSTIFGARDLRVSRFVNDAPSASDSYGFEKPAFRVTMSTASGSVYELIGGREENGERFVRRSDQPNVYAVNPTGLAFLQKDFHRYRSKELPKVARDAVQKVVLHSSRGESFELALASNSWMFKDKPIEKDKVDELIDGYNSSRVSAFIDLEKKSDEQLADVKKNDRLELVTKDGKQVLAFGRGDGTNISIHLEGTAEIYKVSLELYNKWAAVQSAIRKTLEPETPKPGVSSGASLVPVPTSVPDSVAPPGAGEKGMPPGEDHSGNDHSGHDHSSHE